MHMTPVHWLYFGVAMVLLEVMTPGALVSIFFGIAALLVALIAWLLPCLNSGWQWLLFSVFSVLSIVLLRKSLKNVFAGRREVSESPDDAFSGKKAAVTETIAPNRPGRVEFNGTSWVAEADHEIAAGTSVRIVQRANLTLKVESF
jgi:inner membrane protein